MNERASDLYKVAINALQAVSADFGTDDATRAAVNAEISVLRTKIQNAALDDLSSRSANLRELSTRLGSVLQRARGGNVSALQSLAQKVKGAIGV